MRWARACGLAALAAGACAPTEIVLVIQSDLQIPEEVEEVEIVTLGPGGASDPVREELGRPGSPSFPLTLGLRPSGDPGPVTVDVSARIGRRVVVSQRARTSFVSRESRLLPMELLAGCRDVACPPGETCGLAGCRDERVDARALPGWTGVLPPAPPDTHDAGSSDAGDPVLVVEAFDDFEDGVLDALKWSIEVGAADGGNGSLSRSLPLAERDGQLRIEPHRGRATPAFKGYVSVRRFDLTGAVALVEVPEVPLNGAQTVFALDGPGASYVFRTRWHAQLKRNLLIFEDTVAGLTAEAESYRPAPHRFWRFRHAPAEGLLHWETAVAARGPWVSRRSLAVPGSALASVRVALYAGSQSTVDDIPGVARFDNFALGRLQ
jgi:hypothetical protein